MLITVTASSEEAAALAALLPEIITVDTQGPQSAEHNSRMVSVSFIGRLKDGQS